MTDQRDYPNSGSMFMNQKRRDGKNDPNGDGNGEITCEKCQHKNRFFINGWRKDKDRDGNPWWSFAFKHKQPKQDADLGPNLKDSGRDNLRQDSMSLGGGNSKPLSQRQIEDDIPFAPDR